MSDMVSPTPKNASPENASPQNASPEWISIAAYENVEGCVRPIAAVRA